jgi:TRAP-type C4-dicarboxylate transport system substrate-binding protein
MRHLMKYVVLGVSMIVLLFSSSYVFGQAKPIELSYSHQYPASHKSAILATEWAKEIETRTNGRVKITVYPGNTLTPADKNYQSVVNGVSAIGSSTLGYTRGRFPIMEVIDLPLGYKSANAAVQLANEVYNKYKPKELDDTKVMYFFAHGPGFFQTKKAINKLEDFKGMKLRCTGLSAKVVSALGGTPVAMPMPETYDAISRGIVEGSVGPMEALYGWKLAEVIKFTDQNYGSAFSAAFYVVMNKEKWNSLPPDVQKIIEAVNTEWIPRAGKVWDDIDKEGTDFTLKQGNKIITYSKEETERWAKAVRPLLDEYVKNAKDKGLPGDDVLKFCLDRTSKLQ